MNTFQGSMHRLSETIAVLSVEGGSMLMGHPVYWNSRPGVEKSGEIGSQLNFTIKKSDN